MADMANEMHTLEVNLMSGLFQEKALPRLPFRRQCAIGISVAADEKYLRGKADILVADDYAEAYRQDEANPEPAPAKPAPARTESGKR